MTPERDPLEELGAAWRELAPPDPVAGVDAPDAETRATVAWLRSAWRACAPPIRASALPWRLRLRLARPRIARATPWLAAAAAALVLLVAQLERRGPRDSPVPPPVETALEPKLVSLTADRMELRSGPVRLILLTPNPESNR